MASKEPRTRSRRLTSQERKALSVVAEGCGNDQVASELGVVMNAVQRHKGDLMEIRLFLETLDFIP